jgi:hypothetical protein
VSRDRYWQNRFVPSARARLHHLREDQIQNEILHPKFQRQKLAKYLGAFVGTTVSANDKMFVQELGADHVIDYKSQNFEDLLQDYDSVFDTVGGETYKRSLSRKEGRYSPHILYFTKIYRHSTK